MLVLYIWKLLFPTKLLEYQSCDWYLYNFATRMSICRLPAIHLLYVERVIRLVGLEPTTPRLSSACSNQLSYSRVDVEGKDRDSCRRPRLRGVDLRASLALLLHRKEVIQPQVPLRLPCYDFIPVTSLTLGPCLLTVGS